MRQFYYWGVQQIIARNFIHSCSICVVNDDIVLNEERETKN